MYRSLSASILCHGSVITYFTWSDDYIFYNRIESPLFENVEAYSSERFTLRLQFS